MKEAEVDSKLIQIIFQDPVHNSRRTQRDSISKINSLMPFKEITVYEKQKPRNRKCRATDH